MPDTPQRPASPPSRRRRSAGRRTAEPAGDEISRLVERAGLGDRLAWRRIVDAYGELVWAVSRAEGLSRADAEDVCQTTWLKLAERLSMLRDQAALPRWLIITTRREARRLARTRRHEPIEHLDERQAIEELASPVSARHRDDSLWRALAALPAHCQRILRIQAFLPQWTYENISRATGIPVGSIGSTRTRCVRRLRELWAAATPDEVAG